MQTYLTARQVARQLNVSDSTVWRLVWSGALDSVKVGHLRRIPESAVRRYLRNNTAGVA